MLNWEYNDGGFFTLKLFSFKVFSCLINRFTLGSYMPCKYDFFYDKHLRIDIILKRARKGGSFWSDSKSLNTNNRILIYNPAEVMTGFNPVEAGSQYVLTLGFYK